MHDKIKKHFKGVNDPAVREHLKRHFVEAIEPGSKFILTGQKLEDVLMVCEKETLKRFSKMLEEKGEVERIEFPLEFDYPVGTDMLVEIDRDKSIQVLRDPGETFQAWVSVDVRDEKDIPLTNKVIVCAGSACLYYNNKEDFGILTIFPAPMKNCAPSPDFPRSDMTRQEYQEAKKYWDHHGFVISKREFETIKHRGTKGPDSHTSYDVNLRN